MSVGLAVTLFYVDVSFVVAVTPVGHCTFKNNPCFYIFVARMLCHADFTQPQLTNLALNLWNLTQKHGFGSTKYTAS